MQARRYSALAAVVILTALASLLIASELTK